MASKSQTTVGVTEELLTRKGKIPKDYHCKCEYCKGNFLGEIYNTKTNQYYSQLARKKYYDPNAGKHLCAGHWPGYRWAIQQFTKRGDWVFDPTVGTGTAIVESMNHGRKSMGIELEFPEITDSNIMYQFLRADFRPTEYKFTQGNAKDLVQIFKKWKVKKNSISLVVNGTPYPTLGSISSDAPERPLGADYFTDKKSNCSFDYNKKDNFGKKKGDEYWELITGMYIDCIPYMKKGAKMAIIIKDMMRNKKPYLLHKMIIDCILRSTDELKYHGMFMHKHIPSTLFMHTYPKQHPDADQIPLYQTGIVLEKR